MSVLDLNGIKESIQTVLQAQNTSSGASIRDLSSGLTDRITKVFKKHPLHLIGQASEFPCVTVYIDSKSMSNTTIAPNQRTQAKRQAEVMVNVAGLIYNDNFSSNDDDEGEDDIESLMENIEEILRDDYTLGGKVQHIIPEGVEYFTMYKDNSLLISGVLSFKARTFY